MINFIKFGVYITVKAEGIDPNIVWIDIKDCIKDLKHDNIKIDDESLSYCLSKIANYDIIENDQCKYKDIVSYVIITDDVVEYNAYKNDIMIYNNSYKLHVDYDGNCVDDFIKRGVEPKINLIKSLANKISEGRVNRVTYNDYHDTWQYEQDFGCISLIKEHASRIVENCNKQLEALADKYTKL